MLILQKKKHMYGNGLVKLLKRQILNERLVERFLKEQTVQIFTFYLQSNVE